MDSDLEVPSSQGSQESQSLLSHSRRDLARDFPGLHLTKSTVPDSSFDADIGRAVLSTPTRPQPKKSRIILPGKNIEGEPPSDDQVRADPRYWMRSMFKLSLINQEGHKFYECLRCRPRGKIIRIYPDTLFHARKHLNSRVHAGTSDVKDFDDLVAKYGPRGTIKRSASPSSQPDAKRQKEDQEQSFLYHMTSQKDTDYDSVIEVVMCMLPLSVRIFFLYISILCTY